MKDLFTIPEMIYSVKGAANGGPSTCKAGDIGRRIETSIGIAKTTSLSTQKQKRNPSLASENSATSQKSSYSTTSNPYQRATTTLAQNSNNAINSNSSMGVKKKLSKTKTSGGS